jgi:hypothetical protein
MHSYFSYAFLYYLRLYMFILVGFPNISYSLARAIMQFMTATAFQMHTEIFMYIDAFDLIFMWTCHASLS